VNWDPKQTEDLLRGIMIFLFVMLACTGIYHRLRAAHSDEKISRREEGLFILITLRLFGFSAWVGFMVLMIHPAWMQWSNLSLPLWIRWTGAAMAILAVPLFHWMLHSLGTNITDTVVTRKEATLVTQGPYRWVRHPMYSITTLLFAGFTLMTANWFLGFTGLVTMTLLMLRTSKEEQFLIKRFGDSYRDYMRTTGRFFPRL
jgi:protein-S-isoprenylcysteine O-methyltransferase Ste14